MSEIMLAFLDASEQTQSSDYRKVSKTYIAMRKIYITLPINVL